MAQTAHQSCKAEISSCTKKKYLRYQNSNFWKLNEAPCIIFKNTWSRRVDARSATFCYRKLHLIFCFQKNEEENRRNVINININIKWSRITHLSDLFNKRHYPPTWVILLGGTLQGHECFPPGSRKKSNWQQTCHSVIFWFCIFCVLVLYT